MLDKADRDISEVVRFFAARGLEAGYLVPTDTGLAKSIMDAHGQLVGYFRQSGLHDYGSQQKGTEAKVQVTTWIVKKDRLVGTKTSLYRPETKTGDPRLWISELGKHAKAGNLLVLLVHDSELYVVNTSVDGLLGSANDPSSPLSDVLDLLASAKNQPLKDKFSEWNLRLLRSFLSEASKDEEVFLRVDKDLLDQIGQDIGGDRGFLDAIRAGPAWAKPGQSLIERAQLLVTQRTNPIAMRPTSYKDPGDLDPIYRGTRAPTYLPYLAALVRNDAEHPNAYYEGLRDDLKLDSAFGSVEMQKMEQVWLDLQTWTSQLQGRFGLFKLRVLGGYNRIGVPRSQIVLQQNDVENLPRAFVQAELRPDQDLTGPNIARILDEISASPSFYSAAFRSALDKNAFEQPIRSAIVAAYGDWDGTLSVPKAGGQAPGPGHDADATSASTLGLCLAVVGLEPLQLAPLWWIPPLRDSGQFKLKHSGLVWRGDFSGTEGAGCARDQHKEEGLWHIAEQSYEEAIPFEVECFAGDDSEPTRVQLVLPKRQLWILAPFDGPSGDIELRQANLPASGQAYLLAPPGNAARLKEYLQREQPEHSVISARGLPEGWFLACLIDCAALSTDQRTLPDGEDHAHPRPSAIRFVCGRSVRRGYSKMYLSYDLPLIELDAPAGVTIACSPGMRIEEEQAIAHQANEAGARFNPRPRYQIRLTSSGSASYEVRALLDGNPLGPAKRLRVAGLGGELVDAGQPFSFDKFGTPTATSDGLSGVLPLPALGETVHRLSNCDRFQLPTSQIGTPAASTPCQIGARKLFLDSLAQAGSLNYGIARDQLQRLLVKTGEAGEAPLILLDLRSRGHLEIETTPKGHMSRIHAVAPTVFELPIVSSSKRAFGVTGSLRLAHWNRFETESSIWSAYVGGANNGRFRPLRLLANDCTEVRAACAELEVRYSEDPSLAIVKWASDIDSVRDEVFRNPMESIGSAQEGAMRFNATKGIFTARPAFNSCELWKVQDLDTGLDNVYVLSGQSGFAFVRDSRWGVWVALDAFAKWAATLPGMDGVHPIPVTYTRMDGTIWLPARISLPFILERALAYCRGDAPEVFKVGGAATDFATKRIGLSTQEDWPPFVTVNCFYEQMAKGRWLAYRSVPRPVAEVIAQKLGARLDEIG